MNMNQMCADIQFQTFRSHSWVQHTDWKCRSVLIISVWDFCAAMRDLNCVHNNCSFAKQSHWCKAVTGLQTGITATSASKRQSAHSTWNLSRKQSWSLKWRYKLTVLSFLTRVSVLVCVFVCWCVSGLSWVVGDAEELPFDDDQFDIYTIAFGIRNVTHIDQVTDPTITTAFL